MGTDRTSRNAGSVFSTRPATNGPSVRLDGASGLQV